MSLQRLIISRGRRPLAGRDGQHAGLVGVGGGHGGGREGGELGGGGGGMWWCQKVPEEDGISTADSFLAIWSE